jgi:hypothetical protein
MEGLQCFRDCSKLYKGFLRLFLKLQKNLQELGYKFENSSPVER